MAIAGVVFIDFRSPEAALAMTITLACHDEAADQTSSREDDSVMCE